MGKSTKVVGNIKVPPPVQFVVVVDDDGDDDDDVERTRTGPFAARSDLEHQVNHNAKISYFYHVFSSYEKGGPTGSGETRCLAVWLPIP